MKSIDEHIQKDQSEIESAKAEGNLPKVRHLTEELKELEDYKEHHPEDKHDPNALELFCDANPVNLRRYLPFSNAYKMGIDIQQTFQMY